MWWKANGMMKRNEVTFETWPIFAASNWTHIETFAIDIVDRPTQLICISDIYLSTDKYKRHSRAICYTIDIDSLLQELHDISFHLQILHVLSIWFLILTPSDFDPIFWFWPTFAVHPVQIWPQILTCLRASSEKYWCCICQKFGLERNFWISMKYQQRQLLLSIVTISSIAKYIFPNCTMYFFKFQIYFCKNPFTHCCSCCCCCSQ